MGLKGPAETKSELFEQQRWCEQLWLDGLSGHSSWCCDRLQEKCPSRVKPDCAESSPDAHKSLAVMLRDVYGSRWLSGRCYIASCLTPQFAVLLALCDD